MLFLLSSLPSRENSSDPQGRFTVTDVHEEALRIKESKKAATTAPTPSTGTAEHADTTGTAPLETTAAPVVKS